MWWRFGNTYSWQSFACVIFTALMAIICQGSSVPPRCGATSSKYQNGWGCGVRSSGGAGAGASGDVWRMLHA